jgi:tetratricopeptide (TPR) repeat protein
MRWVHVVALAVIVLGFAGLPRAVWAEDPSSETTSEDEKLFNEAVQLAGEGRLEEAYERFSQVAERQPEWGNAHYNAGLYAFLTEKYEQAVAHFAACIKLDADDWRARAKLIQTYQALGKTEEREAQRAELFKRHSESDDEQFAAQRYYCRDQFTVEKLRVFVFEYFEPKLPYKTIYSAAAVSDESKPPDFTISMETPDMTTEVAREMGEIGADERIYSIDGYFDNGNKHMTYALLKKQPTYDEFREWVTGVVKGEIEAVSSMTRKGPAEEADGASDSDQGTTQDDAE